MNETNRTAVTPEELNAFVAALGAKVTGSLKEAYPTCEQNWETMTVEIGQKYARLVKNGAGGNTCRSAYAFVNLENGDILKTAGWKTPAKHARGNIRVGDASNWWNGALTTYGAAYLR